MYEHNGVYANTPHFRLFTRHNLKSTSKKASLFYENEILHKSGRNLLRYSKIKIALPPLRWCKVGDVFFFFFTSVMMHLGFDDIQ